MPSPDPSLCCRPGSPPRGGVQAPRHGTFVTQAVGRHFGVSAPGTELTPQMVARTKGGPLKRRMYTRTLTRALAVVVLPGTVARGLGTALPRWG
ncbi:unnamed protein product [Arctogadus glacialis]